MAYSSDDLTNIQEAIASGKRKVRLGQREVEFHSVEQLLRAKQEIEQSLNRESSSIRRPTNFLARSAKGL